jgi:putative DNA primase/helicase
MMALGDIAAKLGLPVFPCGTDKAPLDKGGFHTATSDEAAIVRAFHRSAAQMIGMPTGVPSGLIVVDVDIKNEVDGRAWLNENREALPQTRTHKTRSGGLHLLFKRPDGIVIRNSQSLVAPGIDVRGDGGYVIIPPSPGYAVADNTPPADMPVWLIRACMKQEREPEPRVKSTEPTNGSTRYGLVALEDECEAITKAPFGRQEKTMNEAALKIGALVAGGQIVESLARAELLAAARSIASASGARPWTDREIEEKIKRGLEDGKRNPRGPKDGVQRQSATATVRSTPANDDGEPPQAPTIDGFDLTEDGIAQAFTLRHSDTLRYCHDTGAWFEWNGKRWAEDRTRRAFSWARIICREFAQDTTAGRKTTLAKVATASAIEKFAQSDQALVATADTWDANPFLLGTPDGTVDLRSGNLGHPSQGDYITKQTAVAPAIRPECPIWQEFLESCTHNDAGLIRFLRQWAGYMLTGDTREHALLFIFGPGGNGKSVFLNTLSGILNDYCKTAAMDSFTATKNEKHSTDLAMLAGARMVCASETEEGKAWAETRIKSLTGGDTITARFMRQDFFEYRPQFKLMIIGNHRPVLHNVDDAVKRRFNVVPFEFKPEKPDLTLEERLKSEWPQILRWMIEGCLDWQKNGLVRPNVVMSATSEYFSEQDVMAQWIEDCCEVTTIPPHNVETNGRLFGSWKSYVLSRSEDPGSAKSFNMALQRRGFTPVKDVSGIRGRGFQGIRVCLDPNADPKDRRQQADD